MNSSQIPRSLSSPQGWQNFDCEGMGVSKSENCIDNIGVWAHLSDGRFVFADFASLVRTCRYVPAVMNGILCERGVEEFISDVHMGRCLQPGIESHVEAQLNDLAPIDSGTRMVSGLALFQIVSINPIIAGKILEMKYFFQRTGGFRA